MIITEIRVTPISDEKIKAIASITLEAEFVIHGLLIVDTKEKGLRVFMPSKKTGKGFRDVAHPITADFRKKVETDVIEAYEKQISNETEEPVTI